MVRSRFTGKKYEMEKYVLICTLTYFFHHLLAKRKMCFVCNLHNHNYIPSPPIISLMFFPHCTFFPSKDIRVNYCFGITFLKVLSAQILEHFAYPNPKPKASFFSTFSRFPELTKILPLNLSYFL